MNNKKIIEKEFFILKINEPNKNFRRYPEELIRSWIVFLEGFKSNEIYSKKINLDDCVIIPKGKAEVRDGVVQKNYKLFGFNLVNKNQSSFVY